MERSCGSGAKGMNRLLPPIECCRPRAQCTPGRSAAAQAVSPRPRVTFAPRVSTGVLLARFRMLHDRADAAVLAGKLRPDVHVMAEALQCLDGVGGKGVLGVQPAGPIGMG